MPQPVFRKILILLGVFLAAWIGVRYLLPFLLPFLVGGGLALAADPLVRFCAKKLPRGISAGIGVSVTLVLILGVLLLLAALLVRELTVLAGIVPNLEDTIRQGLSLLESWLLNLIGRTPESIRDILTQAVSGLFSDGTAFVDNAGSYVLTLASSVLWHLPDSALGLGTGVLAAYMTSAKLPGIKAWLARKMPAAWRDKYLPAMIRLKNALWGWLKAQAKLASVTFLIITGGFLALRVSYAPLWALIVALVDAVPLLGTGIILVPWSVVSFLQGDQIRALGLLALYAAAALTRSALEPKLVGKQLGLDPLLTLGALYAGYKLWGVGGMILAPLIAVAAVQLTEAKL